MSEHKPSRPLIVGMDPGTTLGYAFLDMDGRLLETGSAKQFPIHLLIRKAMDAGTPLFVGTDKRNVPSAVQEFAAKTGARIMAPAEDLKVQEKKIWTKEHRLRNDHERDALAAALFACNEQLPLRKKIEKYARDHDKERLKDALQLKVLTQGINIRDAAMLLENPPINEKPKIPIMPQMPLTVENPTNLQVRLLRLKKENRLLRKQNLKLKQRSAKEEHKHRKETKKLQKENVKERNETALRFKENRIRYFDRALREKNHEVETIRQEKRQLLSYFGKLKDHYLLKKLSHLGQEEWEQKNAILNIQEGDMLLVDDPNRFSEAIVEKIKGRVDIIVHRQPISPKLKEQWPFLFIPAHYLRIEENGYVAIVPRKDVDRERKSRDALQKMVEDYRKERLA